MFKIGLRFSRRISCLAAVIVLFALWFGLDGFFVASRAELAAGDRPYCIETVEPKNALFYLPVEKVEDLSWGHMFNSRGLTEEGGHVGGHHAIMKLENPPEYRNWSYRAFAFVPEVVNRQYFVTKEHSYLAPDLKCAPIAHFTKTLKSH